MTALRCTLAIIFNHPFPANIDKLRRIYQYRFTNIVFLMPLLEIDDSAVITIYRGGYNFHGHIADALERLKSFGSDLYLFSQDDLLLHPSLTPETFWRKANFDVHDGFLPTPQSFYDPQHSSWPWNERVLSRVVEPTSLLYGGGIERFTEHLPSAEVARERLARYGVEARAFPKAWPPISGGRLPFWKWRNEPNATIPYPLGLAFSDFFALRGDALPVVGRHLGLFAAMDLFVEVAVATAMMLGCERMATLKDTPWTVEIDWSDRETIARRTPSDIDQVFATFDDTLLYRHPVKLSAIAVP